MPCSIKEHYTSVSKFQSAKKSDEVDDAGLQADGDHKQANLSDMSSSSSSWLIVP